MKRDDSAARQHQSIRPAAAEPLSWLESIPVAAFVFADQRRLCYVNEAAERLTGYTRRQLLSVRMRLEKLIVPEAREAAREALGRIWAGDELPARRTPFPFILQRKSGERLPITGAARWLDLDGKSVLLACVADAELLSNLYDTLAENERRYRTLMDLCPDAITITDLAGNVLTGTGSIARLAGYKGAEEVAALGLNAFDLIAPEDREKALANARRTLEEGTVRGLEYQLLRKDGSRFPVQLSASVIRDGTGQPSGFVGVTRDISEHWRLIAEKDALSARVIGAQETERARLAQELHDGVGQLLTAAKLEAERLTYATRRPRSMALVAERISQRISAALEMVRGLAHGLRPAVLDDLGLDCALETLAAQTAAAAEISCTADCEKATGLPPTVATTVFRIAQEALANVLRHSGASMAHVRLKRSPRRVVLTVEDDGRGLDDESGGTGLGIISMRERAMHHGGELTIGSRRGGGTRVTARIPV